MSSSSISLVARCEVAPLPVDAILTTQGRVSSLHTSAWAQEADLVSRGAVRCRQFHGAHAHQLVQWRMRGYTMRCGNVGSMNSYRTRALGPPTIAKGNKFTESHTSPCDITASHGVCWKSK